MSRIQRIRLLVLCLLSVLLSAHAHPGHENGPAPAETEVVALIFLDFHSAACSDVSSLLDQVGAARHLKIQKLFKHTPSHPDTLMAHEAALAAGAQGKFVAMHDLLFKRSKPAGTALMNMAKELGLDLKRFEQALDDREFRPTVLRDLAEARGLGVRTTPTVFLAGSKLEGIEAIRALLKGPARPVPPAWDSIPVEPLTLDFAGSPSSGPADAPVTVVEFTDFRCGFCRLHSQVLSELTSAYPGKIRRVFKHYPGEMSAAGTQPHLAAMAALDQSRFWDVHQSLMSKPVEPGPELMDRMKGLGLDIGRFHRDLEAPEKLALIQRDIQEGEKLGIRATPTTFLNGRRLVGRQSLETLKSYVDAILSGRSTAAGAAVLSSVSGDTNCCDRVLAPVAAPAGSTAGGRVP